MSRQRMFNAHRNSYRYKDSWINYFDRDLRVANMTDNQDFVFAWRTKVVCTVYGFPHIKFEEHSAEREHILRVRNENGTVRHYGVKVDRPFEDRDWENSKRLLVHNWLFTLGFYDHYDPSLLEGFDDVLDHGRFVIWLASFFRRLENVGVAMTLKQSFPAPFVRGTVAHELPGAEELNPLVWDSRDTFLDRLKLYESFYADCLRKTPKPN